MLFVDLFCGAGGVTSGIEHAQVFDKKVGKVIACVNHDANAIASHSANHPSCLHFTEDIRTLKLTGLVSVARMARKAHPSAKMCLWASLECTNFSKAKGGLPRDADSRTLAEHLFRYMDAVKFDYIFIENVEEFMSWGPLNRLGKPISRLRGTQYVRWVNKVCDHGFQYEYKILNAADFGAHTSRKRYFGVFARKGEPIRFPFPTHSKKPEVTGLQKWKPVKEVLDFADEGASIFTRKKPLSERTLGRIYAGLIKYVAHGDTSFIQKYYSGRPKGKVNSTDDPCPTITTVNNLTLVQPSFMLKYNSTNKNTGKHIPPSVEDPCPTISAQGRLGLVNAKFLTYYYGNGYESSVNQPCGTLRTKDTAQLVQPEFAINHANWIDRQFTNGGIHSSIEEPAGSVLPVPKMNLVDAWILSPHYDNKGASVEEPMKTITAGRKHHCLMFPQWGMNCSHSIDNPSPVLPARMDKMCPYLVQADETGEPVAIAIFETDSETTVKIKVFMAAYGIIDIKMRMLRIAELKKITGFEETYVLKGTQQEQKKYIGNAVPVLLAKAIIESFASALHEPIKVAA